MNLESKIELEYNSGVVGKTTGVLRGFIESLSWLSDFNVIGVNYVYADVSGNVVNKGGFSLKGDDINSLNASIESSITEQGYREKEMQRAYLAFQKQMALTFSVSEDDIEIKTGSND